MSQTYTIEKAESSTGSMQYVLTVGEDRVYYVGELICLIIERLSEGKSKDEIKDLLNSRFEGRHVFSNEDIDQLVDEKIGSLGLFGSEGAAKTINSPIANIRGKLTLTRFETIKPLVDLFKPLFTPKVFLTLFIGLILVNSYYMYVIYSQHLDAVLNTFKQTSGCGRSVYFLLLFYPSAFLLLYLHEVGHSAAAYRFKVIPKTIGVGFYLIFPVLYTELNGAWKLDRVKRTIINFAGIFMQLLWNLVLLSLVFNVEEPTVKIVLQYLIQMNILTIVLNLNPFFKFDGYWIISDALKLPNLRQQSNYYLVKGVQRLFPRTKLKLNPAVEKIVNPRNPFLIVYSFAKYLFIAFILWALLRAAYYSIYNLVTLSYNMVSRSDYSVCTVEELFKRVFGFGILLYFVSPYLKRMVNFVSKKMSNGKNV